MSTLNISQILRAVQSRRPGGPEGQAKLHTATAQSVLDHLTATILAGEKDVDRAVSALRASIQVNEDRRMYATYDPSFQPIANEKALLALLRATAK